MRFRRFFSANIVRIVFILVTTGLQECATAQNNAGQRKPGSVLRDKTREMQESNKRARERSSVLRDVPPGIDGRAEANKRSDERYTSKQMMTQPRHRALEPLDPDEERAAIYELAELASFELYVEGDVFSTTNGVGRGAQILPIDLMEQLERTLRFDRLMSSSDRNFKELVSQVRAITEDVARLNRANHDFGLVAGLEESLMLSGFIFEGFAHVFRWQHLESARANATSTERLPDGRTIERFDQNRYEQLAATDSRLATLFESAAARDRADTAEKLEQRKLLSRRTDAIRGLLQERMASLWQQEILPRLERHAGPELEVPLIDIGNIPVANSPKQVPPARPLIGDGRVQTPRTKSEPPPRYGEVRFRSRSGRAIDHFTLAVQMRDNFANETLWFLHLPRLDGKRVYRLVEPNWARRVYPGGADQINGTYVLYSEAGRAASQPIDLEPTTPRTPRGQEKKEKMQQALDRLIEEERTRRGEAREVLELVRLLYPAARNPETARARLIAALQNGGKYRSHFKAGEKHTIATMEIEPFDTDAAEVLASLTLTESGETEQLALMGRIADEADRGCVIGFVPVDGEPHEMKLAREMRMPGSYEARAKLRFARWKKGGLPLFTSTAEFFADWQPDTLMLSGPRGADNVQAKIAEFGDLRKQWEFACDVVYLDNNERLWLQHQPAAGVRSEIDYAPLRRE